ncbi:MAG TPA: RMD1 family protein [Polyangiaceae bacterium]|jgi:uncharacterized Rmd1/YagE family protein|nr:RMD1 family protein [Polyangiaceae bacterium]
MQPEQHLTLLRPAPDPGRIVRFPPKGTFQARALCVGERIDLKAVDAPRVAGAPSLFRVGEKSGMAAVFRYGVVVFFNADPPEQGAFVAQLASAVRDGLLDKPQEEDARITFGPAESDTVIDGVMQLCTLDPHKLELIADALAKSVKLAHYENQIDEAFRKVEPLAAQLQRHGEAGRQAKKLVRQIGSALLIEHQMVWRMEVTEKPEVLWDHPELERLHARLVDEYELKERYQALEHKLELLARTISTVLNLLHNKRSLRVEYYIVTLIVIEIGLSLFHRAWPSL